MFKRDKRPDGIKQGQAVRFINHQLQVPHQDRQVHRPNKKGLRLFQKPGSEQALRQQSKSLVNYSDHILIRKSIVITIIEEISIHNGIVSKFGLETQLNLVISPYCLNNVLSRTVVTDLKTANLLFGFQ